MYWLSGWCPAGSSLHTNQSHRHRRHYHHHHHHHHHHHRRHHHHHHYHYHYHHHHHHHHHPHHPHHPPPHPRVLVVLVQRPRKEPRPRHPCSETPPQEPASENECLCSWSLQRFVSFRLNDFCEALLGAGPEASPERAEWRCRDCAGGHGGHESDAMWCLRVPFSGWFTAKPKGPPFCHPRPF